MKSVKQPSVAIIVLHWIDLDTTLQCLESVFRIEYNNYVVILFDNSGDMHSQQLIRKKFPQVTILSEGKNVGFCRGNNIAISHALKNRCDYVLLLNSDTLVTEDFLDCMIGVAEFDQTIAIVGPALYEDREMHHLGSTGSKISFTRGVSISIRDTGTSILDVSMVSGACMLVKKMFFEKIGTFNEEYFAYYEDIEFCFKAKKLGLRVVCATKAKVYHHWGRWYTRNKLPCTYRLFTKNRLLFVFKNGDAHHNIFLLLYFFLFDIPKHFVLCFIHCRPSLFVNYLRGIIDFFLRTPPEKIVVQEK